MVPPFVFGSSVSPLRNLKSNLVNGTELSGAGQSMYLRIQTPHVVIAGAIAQLGERGDPGVGDRTGCRGL